MMCREKSGNNLWGCQTWQHAPLPTETTSQPLVYDFLYAPRKVCKSKYLLKFLCKNWPGLWTLVIFPPCVCAGGGEGEFLGSEPRASHLLGEHFTTECIPSHHHAECLTQEGISDLMD